MKFTWIGKGLLGAALMAAAAFTEPAEGALIAASSIDGGARIFAVDNDATQTCGAIATGPCQLADLDPTANSLVTNFYTTAAGDLTVSFSVQTSNKGPVNRLDSTGTQFTNIGTTGHSFIGVISDTGFIGPSTTATTTGAGQWSHLGEGYGDSQIAMQWFNDPANGQGALTTGIGQPGTIIDTFADLAGPANPDSFSHIGGPFAVNDPGLFSMTLRFEGFIEPGVRLTGREQTELKAQVVPNPSALLFLGSALGLAGVIRRVRRG